MANYGRFSKKYKSVIELQKTQSKLVVGAIDFGTTNSGYAYSFYSDYKKDHLKIYANQAWNADGEGLVTLKAPTIVLFDKNDKFHSFGFDAEKKYMELATTEEHIGWKYFRRFKMKLNEKLYLKRRFTLLDDQDKPKPAKDVVAAAIKYLKDHLVNRIQLSVPEIKETDIYWVLTVPAIWHDGARQFMKESAQQAGIQLNNFTLALEPECAAVFCKESISRKSSQLEDLCFSTGSQFMVVDMGGTVDITIHEVDRNGSLIEVTTPSGGPWGGICVDKAFDDFLVEIFSKTVIQELGRGYKEDDLDMQRGFELKKRTLTGNDKTFVMRFPSALFEVFSNVKGVDFNTSISRSSFASTLQRKSDKIIIKSPEKIIELFDHPKSKVISHLHSELAKRGMGTVKALLLVGGFSESEIMQTAIKNAFTERQVLIPEEAGLAVVKGAVMYGHNPDSISTRKMPYTIGLSTATPFNPNRHPEHKKTITQGLERCEDVFKIFIKKGTEIVKGKTQVEHVFNCRHSPAQIEIYRSSVVEPVFVTDEGCSRVALLCLESTNINPGETKVITIQMIFGSES